MDTATLRKSITAALIITLNKVLVTIAIGSLIFSGELAPYLPRGIGLLLTGTALTGALLAIFSAIPGVIAAPKTGLSPIFALLAIGVAAAADDDGKILVNVCAALLTASFIAGLVLLLLGQLRFGKLVRFIPYPVIGGFFAGFSFLLFKGGLSVAGGFQLSLANLGAVFSVAVAPKLLAAIIFGGTLFLAERRLQQRYTFVVVVALACAMFWSTKYLLAIENVSGWLLPISSDQAFVTSDLWRQLADINWMVIFQQYDIFIVVSLMAVVMLLFDISAIETFSGTDIDLNRELRRSGWANMLGATSGGMLSLQTAADTALNYRLYGPSRLVVLTYCFFCLLLFYVGPALLIYLPGFVVGGLLVYLSLGVLMTWIVQIRNKLPLQEYCVIWAILLVMASVGILEAVALGLLLTIIIFVVRYSRFSVIKFRLSGLERRSNVDRDADNVALLDKYGQRTIIVGLQSSIFFGTAARLLEDLQNTIDEVGPDEIDFLILDFQRVNTLDTSGGNILLKMRGITKKHDISLVFTELSEEMLAIFDFIGLFVGDQADHLKRFSELDEALEWCEGEILKAMGGHEQPQVTRDQMLARIFTDEVSGLKKYFNERLIAAGDYLFRQGDDADCMYFVLGGAITISLHLPDGGSKRLKELHGGATLGEMAFYAGGQRSADAIAKSDSSVVELSVADFARLQADHPMLAGRFHAFVVRLLARRLRHADEEIAAMAR